MLQLNIIFLSQILFVLSETRIDQYSIEYSTPDRNLKPETLLGKYQVPSVSSCLAMCLGNDTCGVVGYDEDSRICCLATHLIVTEPGDNTECKFKILGLQLHNPNVIDGN